MARQKKATKVTNFIIKWTNKFSGETGFVGKVSTKEACFYNSDFDGARRYATEQSAQKAIKMLEAYGEAVNNTLEVQEEVIFAH